MKRVMLTAIILFLACSTFAQPVSHEQNLNAGLNGWSCDHSMLTAGESSRVATAGHSRSLNAYLNGWTCDHSMLTAEEWEQIQGKKKEKVCLDINWPSHGRTL